MSFLLNRQLYPTLRPLYPISSTAKLLIRTYLPSPSKLDPLYFSPDLDVDYVAEQFLRSSCGVAIESLSGRFQAEMLSDLVNTRCLSKNKQEMEVFPTVHTPSFKQYLWQLRAPPLSDPYQVSTR